MKVPFVKFGKQYLDHKEEFDSEIQRILSSGDLILREDVEKFEENLAKFVGTKYAIALSNGTDALKLAYEGALNEFNHWSISIPSHTFKSTAGAIYTVHPDISIDQYDFGDVPNGANLAVVAHIAGELYPLPEVKYHLIEDACQAIGAIKNPISFAQCWSFYPAKILGSFGDAGALTTNNKNLYEFVKESRNHFKSTNYEFGGNYRMDNLQAAILNVKFKYLQTYLDKREAFANKYKDLKGVILPNYQKGRVWQDYIIRISNRDELYEYLKQEGIETMKNEYPWLNSKTKLPKCEAYEKSTLRLPCTPEHTKEEIEFVIEKINSFYDKK